VNQKTLTVWVPDDSVRPKNAFMGLAASIGLRATAPLGTLTGVRWLFVLTETLGTLVSVLAFLSRKLRGR